LLNKQNAHFEWAFCFWAAEKILSRAALGFASVSLLNFEYKAIQFCGESG
jgi:hypothetical protein